MPWKLDVVLRNDNHESLLRLLDLHQIQNLQIVLIDLMSQRIRTDVNDIDIWILDAEDPRDLRILPLLELLDGHPLEFCDRVRIDVNLNALLVLYCLPGVLELVLHLVPDSHGVRP